MANEKSGKNASKSTAVDKPSSSTTKLESVELDTDQSLTNNSQTESNNLSNLPTDRPEETKNVKQNIKGSALSSSNVKKTSVLGGWLAFFMVVFAIAGFANIGVFFAALAELADGNGSASLAVSMICSLVAGGIFLVSAVLIGLQKRIARNVSLAALAAGVTSITLQSIVSLIEICSTRPLYGYGYYSGYSGCSASNVVESIGLIVMVALAYGLVVVYFMVSSRVKETLVR